MTMINIAYSLFIITL